MTQTKTDVSEGIEGQIKLLGGIVNAFRARKIFVRDDAGADVTSQYDEQISECARQLDRLKVALDLLHFA